jgi:hypothetical protein
MRLPLLTFLGVLLVGAGQASAECAWVMWERSEYRDPRTGGLTPSEWKLKEAYEAKRDCDSELARSAKFLVKYAYDNNRRAERLGNRITHWDGAALHSVYTLQCLPDAVDPRGQREK